MCSDVFQVGCKTAGSNPAAGLKLAAVGNFSELGFNELGRCVAAVYHHVEENLRHTRGGVENMVIPFGAYPADFHALAVLQGFGNVLFVSENPDGVSCNDVKIHFHTVMRQKCAAGRFDDGCADYAVNTDNKAASCKAYR